MGTIRDIGDRATPRTRRPAQGRRRRGRQPPVTVDELAHLPAVLDLMTAARILGLGRSKAYQLAQTGNFPCRVVRIGDQYRVSAADLRRLLGLPPEPTGAPP